MPDTDYHNYPEDLELLMPWSETVSSKYSSGAEFNESHPNY